MKTMILLPTHVFDGGGWYSLQGGDKVAKVGFVAGTIQQDKINSFERLLFRATRGNMYLRSVSVGAIRDPVTGEEQDKSVFVVFFAGDRARAKVNKVRN